MEIFILILIGWFKIISPFGMLKVGIYGWIVWLD